MSRNRNHDRADWAAKPLDAFRRETGVDEAEDAVHDLVADLGHYCCKRHSDFNGITANAVSCWATERADPTDSNIAPGPNVSIIISGRRHPMRARRQSALTRKARGCAS